MAGTIMPNRVTLVGLDFGTTTSSAVVATAALLRNTVTGRTELSQVRERFRSEMLFTPLDGDRIDVARAEATLDAWLTAGGVRTDELFGGGALLTGLTAQYEKAALLVELIRRRLGDALIATADDPCLESWLAVVAVRAYTVQINDTLALMPVMLSVAVMVTVYSVS
jgi:ethanolamine utilization protein EutA